MKKRLHIDVETYSSVDIRESGSYKYMESDDFEVLMVAFSFDDGPIEMIDLAQGEELPDYFIIALHNDDVEKHAYNATFERNAFAHGLGHDVPANQWHCTLVKGAYCGLPMGLDNISKALKLPEDKAKMASGKELIKTFSIPKKDGSRTYPEDAIGRWEEFKQYCIGDVRAEREIYHILKGYTIPEFERRNYILDQKINDHGIEVDLDFAKIAYETDIKFVEEIKQKVKDITGVDNPNSPAQLKGWLGEQMQKEIKSLAKDLINDLIKEAGPGPVSDVLRYRKKMSKTSVKKYTAMLNSACSDNRVRGLFQYYGANRTGRWAGRGVQLQNLTKHKMNDVETAREIVAAGDYEIMKMVYDDMSSILSQLIRTAFVASKDRTFCVADFSAIEARVLSWLASETWREEVFRGHGKIYEASAAMMFKVPIEQVTKESDLRAKGKNAELALGYQGAVGAMVRMGGEEMGMNEIEMKAIVSKWRKANPKIVQLWEDMNTAAIASVKSKKRIKTNYKGITFDCDDKAMTIELPSSRKLFYWSPAIKVNKFGSECVAYKNIDQKTKQWFYTDTYGGKIVENIVQAISRDILADSMLRLDEASFDITMHVHDEVVAEIDYDVAIDGTLDYMCEIMSEDIPWAKGLPLKAVGFTSKFYKKD